MDYSGLKGSWNRIFPPPPSSSKFHLHLPEIIIIFIFEIVLLFLQGAQCSLHGTSLPFDGAVLLHERCLVMAGLLISILGNPHALAFLQLSE